MGNSQFDYQKAIQAGYSQADIQTYLKQNPDLQTVNSPIAQPSQPTASPNDSNIDSVQSAAQTLSPPKQQIDYQKAIESGYNPVQIKNFIDQAQGIEPMNAPAGWDQGLTQSSIVPSPAPLTETFGQYQPGVEVFSNGVTPGIGLGVDQGTPVALPGGQWEITEAYKDAKRGGIGDNENKGWGNSIVAKNKDTGEALRFSHLSQVDVSPGDVIKGGYIVGKTGTTGNSTGPHLNLAYYDQNGNLGDVLKSPYASSIPIKQ